MILLLILMPDETEQKLNEICSNLPASFQRAVCRDCRERGRHGTHPCNINLNRLPHRLILNADAFPKAFGEDSCDCIIFLYGDLMYICVTELKSTRIRPESIKKKFDDTTKRINAECSFLMQEQFEPRFILVYQSIQPIDRERIAPYRFRLFNKEKGLMCQLCGYELRKIFDS